MQARPAVSEEMVEKVARELVGRMEDIDEDQAVKDIVDTYRHPMDGFELVTSLIKWEGWHATRDEMDILDEMDSRVRKEHKKACKVWAEENDIQPPYSIDTEIQEGVIKGICKYDVARYLVKEHGCQQEGRHRLINFEDARAV